MSDYRCAVCGARAVVVRGAEGSRKWLCRAHAGDAPDDWPVLAYQRDESDEPDSGEGESKAGAREGQGALHRPSPDTGPPLGPEPSPYARPRPIALPAPLPFPTPGSR